MLVMALHVNNLAGMVQKRRHFKGQPEFRRHSMQRSELVEERGHEAPNALGVHHIAMKPGGKLPGMIQQGARAAFIRTWRTEMLHGQLAKNSFSDANARDQKGLKLSVFRQAQENHCRNAHDFSAVTAYFEGAHTSRNIAAQDFPGSVAQ